MIKVGIFHEYPLEEGATINDVITDDSSILDILKELQEDGLKETQLIINSRRILVKNIWAPQLSKKELLEITKGELADINGSYEDLIYSYSVLQSSFGEEGKEGREISYCAVERKLPISYIKLFDATGIRLKGVDISINILHKLTQELVDLDGKTCIVSVLDGNNIFSCPFEKDHYTFSDRTRLFSEQGTQAFISEMNNNISQLIQFSKSKQSPYPIEKAYFYDLDDVEGLMAFKSIRSNLSLRAEQFPDSEVVYVTGDHYEGLHLHDCVFPIGCPIRRRRAGDVSR